MNTSSSSSIAGTRWWFPACRTWPNSHTFWRNQRVTVTGGAGFLGSFVVEKLRERGAAHIFIPRRQDYDLVQRDAVLALLHDARPDLIIHLAARVGGIGANLTHQAEYFYENLMMGTQLLHEAYVTGVPKFVAVGAICGYPQFAPIPFREEDLWNGYPGQACATWQTTCG
ncbi:MAG: NAD-dependent epimerase/dehydratase family protein [Anaerolineae bacterium]